MTDLSKAERLWLDRDDDRPRGGYQAVIGQLGRAVRDYRQYTADIAAALAVASVDEPPPSRGSAAGRVSSSDVPDPALQAILSTGDAVRRATVRYAHLLAPCGGDCDHAAVDLAGLLETVGADPHEAVLASDGLAHTEPWQTGALRAGVAEVARLHGDGAELLAVAVKQLDDVRQVTDLVGRLCWLTVQAGRARGSVAQWMPGPLVRTCVCVPGCRAPANHGRFNDAHRKRNERRPA